MTENSGETALIRQCLAGDVESYGLLVDRYSARVINLAYMMLGDRHESEDIAQEAFIRSYRSLGKFEKKAKFSSWLFQIALNLCKDRLKARSRHARSVDDDQLNSIDGDPRDQAPQQIVENELSENMKHSISKLPYPYREAFVLRHLQGMDYEEVAVITGVPADTVRVRAYRARELLREALSPQVDTFWREKAAREKSGAKG